MLKRWQTWWHSRGRWASQMTRWVNRGCELCWGEWGDSETREEARGRGAMGAKTRRAELWSCGLGAGLGELRCA
jgi:hypothetical protein